MFVRFAAAFVLLHMMASSCAEASPPERGGPWLLNGLQSLADQGALFSPRTVEQVFDLKLSADSHQFIPQPPDCSDDRAGKSQIATDYASKPGWLKPSSEGVKDMKVPEFLINRAYVSGSPTFSYQDTTIVNCSGKFSLDRSRQATLSFNDLPAFACFRRDDLVKALHATQRFATDGVDLVDYRGQANDTFETDLQFVFRAGAACALGTTLRQDTDRGYRYLRARAKWEACRIVAERDFCSTNGRFGWGDGKKTGEMEEAAVKSCGTMTLFYEREPLSGQPPSVMSRQLSSQGPCPD